jgi:hypothetical protein
MDVAHALVRNATWFSITEDYAQIVGQPILAAAAF